MHRYGPFLFVTTFVLVQHSAIRFTFCQLKFSSLFISMNIEPKLAKGNSGNRR